MPRRSKLPYTTTKRVGGKVYWYVRHAPTFGKQLMPIKGAFGSSEFASSYAAWLRIIEGNHKRITYDDGTVGWLVQSYLASEDFQELAPRTQSSYKRELDRLEPMMSDPVSLINRVHIAEVIKHLSKTPRMAKMFAQVFSLLWQWGVRELDIDGKNPAYGFGRKYRPKSFRPWAAEEQATFEASEPQEWLMTAYMLARYTGARRGDIVAMTAKDRVDGAIRVQGEKTGNPIWIPEHPELARYLDGLGSRFYLVEVGGKVKRPIKPESLSHGLRKHLQAIGLPSDLVLHGLRHTAGKELAEAGCSTHEIAAVLGHKTLQMVQHYTKGVDQRRLSSAAIIKLTRKK